MRAVVDGVARDYEADRGHVEAGGVVGVGVAYINRDNLVTFKVKRPAIHPFSGGRDLREFGLGISCANSRRLRARA